MASARESPAACVEDAGRTRTYPPWEGLAAFAAGASIACFAAMIDLASSALIASLASIATGAAMLGVERKLRKPPSPASRGSSSPRRP